MTTNDSFSLEAFIKLPRIADLAISPDGQRLVTTVATPDPDGKRYRTALYALDAGGSAPPRRLTRSGAGESAPAFLPDGALLFASARPDPDSTSDEDDDAAGLWRMPPQGEAELVADPPAGVSGLAVADGSGALVVSTGLHPGASDWEADRERASARKDAGVTAQLYDGFPIRFWDRWYGPRQPHLFAASSPGGDWVGLTPEPGYAHEQGTFDISPDGRTVVTTRWRETPDPRYRVTELVAIHFDGASAGEPRVIASEERAAFRTPACSPDSAWVAFGMSPLGSPDAPGDNTLAIVPADGSEPVRDILPGFDRWPSAPVWAPDGRSLFFTADDDGHCPPFRVHLDNGRVERLAAQGHYASLTPAPDGRTLYAIRDSVGSAPRVVALDLDSPEHEARVMRAPGDDIETPGAIERVETTASDGTRVPGWLVLPPGGDGPAPLAVLVHGGPLASWNMWHWRWNPHVLAARGWAVLMPDPALSTGYGLDYIQRGWGRWGAEPYTDILALVDAVEARDDIDAERTAALGGSFGGYMANWIAGQTDRFAAIVTHASLWNLEAFHGATDLGPWWEHQMGDRYRSPERYREWSPHQFVDRISTPMLVIHGERDFRVPVSEALALWTDLRRHGVDCAYLHFPDENHWVLTPQHAGLWYETVIAFLDHHVLGKPWEPPDLVR